MCDAALDAADIDLARKYAAITLRLIKYRVNLFERFLLEDIS